MQRFSNSTPTSSSEWFSGIVRISALRGADDCPCWSGMRTASRQYAKKQGNGARMTRRLCGLRLPGLSGGRARHANLEASFSSDSVKLSGLIFVPLVVLSDGCLSASPAPHKEAALSRHWKRNIQLIIAQKRRIGLAQAACPSSRPLRPVAITAFQRPELALSSTPSRSLSARRASLDGPALFSSSDLRRTSLCMQTTRPASWFLTRKLTIKIAGRRLVDPHYTQHRPLNIYSPLPSSTAQSSSSPQDTPTP